MPADAGAAAVYLYALVRRGAVAAGDLGVEDVEGGRAVGLIGVGGLDAVVSPVPLADYADNGGGAADADWAVPRALRHARVVGEVAARAASLPARFGTVFSGPEALAGLVGRHLGAVSEFLDGAEGREEWSVRCEADLDAAEEYLLREDPEFAARFRSLPEAPGARFFKEKALRASARTAARRLAREAAGPLLAEAGGLAPCRDLPPRRAAAPGREPLFHVACLPLRGEAGPALDRLRGLAAASSPPLSLDATGPWPPFSFCPELR